VRVAVAVALAAAACGRHHITSCDDDLGGVYADDDDRRWMILDDGASLEGYPLFDDFHGGSGLEVAPRALDLYRPKLVGEVRRRYTRYPGGDACTTRAPVRVTACADDELELVLGDPAPPVRFAPCAQPVADSRAERWRLQP
jgi:hypothetical protein